MYSYTSTLINTGKTSIVELDSIDIEAPCPLCVKFTMKRKWESLNALNSHLYKSHKLDVTKEEIENIISILRLLVLGGGLRK